MLFLVLDLVRIFVDSAVLVQVVFHGPVCEIAMSALDQFERVGIQVRLKLESLDIFIFIRLFKLFLVLVVLLSVAVDQVRSR